MIGRDEASGRRRRPWARLAVVVAVVVAVSLVKLMLMQLVLVPGQVRLDALKVGVAEQEDRYRSLRLELAQLVAPDRVVVEAERLGLVRADRARYVPEPGTPDEPERASGGGTPTGEPPGTGGDRPAVDGSEPPARGRPWASVKPFLGP
ncbi:MAG: hypothetical protein ACRDZ9_04545 [Acidimicrobiales bacterium]